MNDKIVEFISGLDFHSYDEFNNMVSIESSIDLDGEIENYDFSWINEVEKYLPFITNIVNYDYSNIKVLVTYENRFIKTLIYRLYDFLNSEYKKFNKINFSSNSKTVKSKVKTTINNEIVEVDIKISSILKEDLKKGESYGLSLKERIERVLELTLALFETEFMKQLNSESFVHSPVTKTEVFEEELNYRKCLELFNFIENYNSSIKKLDINIVKNQSLQVDDYIKELEAEFKFTLPVPLSYYQVSLEFFEGEKNYNHIVEIVNNLLVKAKVSGTRSLVSCDDSVLEDMEYKRFIFDVLKRELNLESDQFQVYYQPIFSIKENKFVYMEALSRLLNTERGNISPVDFVAVAENKGLIDKLGDVAFEKICKFISENKDVVNAVSVNFSVYQISSPNIVDKVLNTIEKFGLSPSNIIIEITESVFIENFELINSNIEKLANAGIKFYLDDFGTGYSNLTTVISLPFSTVKMDRSLVLTMEESNRNYKLVKNLISTFKDANLEVLVEGVETQEQNYLVKNAGADYVQGYLYSKPLSAADCIKLLK